MSDAAVVLHPHPSMGGDSSHPFVQTTAALLRMTGTDVITPDLRDPDVGASAAELTRLADTVEGDRLLLIGYSWGSIVTSHASPGRLAARVLVAPPGQMPLGNISTVPSLALLPEHDQFGGAVLPESTLCEVVRGADHFLFGHVDLIAKRAVEWISELG